MIDSKAAYFEATYYAIVFRTMLFVFAMNALLMLALTDVMDLVGTHVWGKRVVVAMLGLAFIAIGNLLPRTRPNIAFGIRTQRTLTNPQLWQQVHRVGGYAAVGVGLMIAIVGMTAPMRDMMAIPILASLCAAATAVVVTYVRHARV